MAGKAKTDQVPTKVVSGNVPVALLNEAEDTGFRVARIRKTSDLIRAALEHYVAANRAAE